MKAGSWTTKGIERKSERVQSHNAMKLEVIRPENPRGASHLTLYPELLRRERDP